MRFRQISRNSGGVSPLIGLRGFSEGKAKVKTGQAEQSALPLIGLRGFSIG